MSTVSMVFGRNGLAQICVDDMAVAALTSVDVVKGLEQARLRAESESSNSLGEKVVLRYDCIGPRAV